MSINSVNNKIISKEQLSEIRDKHQDKKVIFTAGSFDILHTGHVVYLSKCKQLGDILVVGLGRDSVIKRLKGDNRPINSENNRLFFLAALQDVDYVILDDDTPQTIESAELDYIENLILLKPDLFCINNDNPRLDLNKKAVENLGIMVEVMNRDLPEGINPTSTSQIIDKLS
ncbi:MAG TPA: adenylyltransferase/cytidyltransferase family protein [Candidatus Nanoarchaeia archaeon]|nr:adenylyltransferase/cytidyltransferase family protein [Candidatus Nanoarchaeia archaeon]